MKFHHTIWFMFMLFACNTGPVESNDDKQTTLMAAPAGEKAATGMAATEISKEALASELKNMQDLRKSLAVTLRRKGFVEGSFGKHFSFQIKIENKTDKDIKSFLGILLITMPGDKTKEVFIDHDKAVAANSSIRQIIEVEYDALKEEDQRLKALALEDLDVDWLPERIVFVDGSALPAIN